MKKILLVLLGVLGLTAVSFAAIEIKGATVGGALVGDFIPTEFSGCVLWLDASDGTTITKSGAGDLYVSEWRDKSGNGYHVAQGTLSKQPAYINTLNGRNVITFDGATENLKNTSFPNISQPYTVFLVAKLDAATAGLFYFDSAVSSPRTYFWLAGDPLKWNSSGFVSSLDPDTNIHVFSLTYNTTSSSMFIDGNLESDVDISGTVALSGLMLGNKYTEDRSIEGHICEMIIYQGAVTLSQRIKMEDYLSSKWGIT